MATYKAVMRPALEYASCILDSINKLQVILNAALRTAIGCKHTTSACQNTHTCHTQASTAPRVTIQIENTTSITSLTQTYNILQQSKGKKPSIFNNDSYTTNIPTYPQTVTTTDIKQTCSIYMHLLSLGIQPQEAITKYCAHLHHTLAALKRYFTSSLAAPLPTSEQINHPFSSHTYTKSTPNHIHHHYAPFVTFAYTPHIIFNCTHICTTLSPLDLWTDLAVVTALLARWMEKLAGGPQGRRSDSKW